MKALIFIGGAMVGGSIAVLFMSCFYIGSKYE